MKSLENFGILHVLIRPNTSELSENKLASRHMCWVYTSQIHRDEVAPTKGIKVTGDFRYLPAGKNHVPAGFLR